MSANYLMEEGIMKYTQYERAGMRLNSEFKIGNKLTVGQRLNVTYDKEPTTPNNPVQRAIGSNPLIPVYDTNGNFAGTYQQSAELGIHNNAVADLYRSKDDYNKNLRVIAEGFLNWNITPELEFKSQASIQMRDLHGRYFQAKNPEHSEALATNTLTEQHFRQDEWNVSNLLNYKNSFGGHTLDIWLVWRHKSFFQRTKYIENRLSF